MKKLSKFMHSLYTVLSVQLAPCHQDTRKKLMRVISQHVSIARSLKKRKIVTRASSERLHIFQEISEFYSSFFSVCVTMLQNGGMAIKSVKVVKQKTHAINDEQFS